MNQGLLRSLRQELLPRRPVGLHPGRSASSTTVAIAAIVIFLLGSVYPVWRNKDCPGVVAGLVVALTFSCLYGVGLAVPLLAGRRPAVITATANLGLLTCGYGFWMAFVTILPGRPLVEAKVWRAGQSIPVSTGYRGPVTIKLRGAIAAVGGEGVRVKVVGPVPPVARTIASSHRRLRIGARDAHLRVQEFAVNVQTILPDGTRSLEIAQLEGKGDGPIIVQAFPERSPAFALPVALLSVIVAALFQTVTRISSFAAVAGATIGAGLAIVHRGGPDPDLGTLLAALAFGGGLGMAIGVVAATGLRRGLSARLNKAGSRGNAMSKASLDGTRNGPGDERR